MNGSSPKPLICIYTNNEKNEFAVGFREDENFRAVTKVGDFYTRLLTVVAFESTLTTNELIGASYYTNHDSLKSDSYQL